MRTTVTFDDDVSTAIERLRRDRAVGLSEVVNDLIRRGLVGKDRREPVRLETVRLDLRLDVSNVAEALEIAEGHDRR